MVVRWEWWFWWGRWLGGGDGWVGVMIGWEWWLGGRGSLVGESSGWLGGGRVGVRLGQDWAGVGLGQDWVGVALGSEHSCTRRVTLQPPPDNAVGPGAASNKRDVHAGSTDPDQG